MPRIKLLVDRRGDMAGDVIDKPQRLCARLVARGKADWVESSAAELVVADTPEPVADDVPVIDEPPEPEAETETPSIEELDE